MIRKRKSNLQKVAIAPTETCTQSDLLEKVDTQKEESASHEAEAQLRELDERIARRKGWTCGSCAHAREWIASSGHVTGFVSCAESRSAWRKRAPSLICSFYPTHFKLATKVIEEKNSAR